MDELNKSINENLNKNYELFSKNLENNFEMLAGLNIETAGKYVSAEKTGKDYIILKFFNHDVLVDIKAKKVSIADNKDPEKLCSELDLFASSLIVHYLLNTTSSTVYGEWILYRDLPDGLFYASTIPGVLKPILRRYQDSGPQFIERIIEIGGKKDKSGKYSGIVFPFKRFPILFILDEKDEEFDAGIRALFDRSASHCMKADIIKTLLVYTVKKLL